MMQDRNRIDKISRQEMLSELRRVAEHYNMRRFSGKEFDLVSKSCSKSTLTREFGTWENALNALGFELEDHRNSRSDRISDIELANELNRVWVVLGHRPSRTEWEGLETKYSYTTYKRRFGGWANACAAVENLTSSHIAPKTGHRRPDKILSKPAKIEPERKRNIPDGLRLKILKRDHFKCVYCGRSPSTDPTVQLHIDHIKPFSKNGETSESNLQTLCKECNLGKGSDE